MPSAVTILQIADRLNLSHSTVSRVLNNKANTSVSEETRRRVLAVAREMGYRPNLAARSLRDSRSNMVGIFASPDVGIWSGGAFEISSGLSAVLHAQQLHVFLALTAEDQDEQQALPAWRFDGAILLQQPPRSVVDYLVTVNRPFVAVNEWVSEGISVLADDTGGVQMALDHLWELGHRRIAYAGASQWHFGHYSVKERCCAYLDYMTAHGMEPVPGYDLEPDHQVPAQRTAWLRRAVLDGGATAVLAYDHVVAVEIVGAAQRLMLRVPQDFSLACFNNDMVTERFYPPLTVVTTRGEEMGRKAADLLLQCMADKGVALSSAEEGAPGSVFRVPEQLIVRASTAPPAV